MVHCFECLGVYMAVDSDSGSVHVLDRLAYELLRSWDDGEARGRLCCEYGEEAVAEAETEIRGLIDAGQLFYKLDAAEIRRPAPAIKALCLHAAHDCDLRCGYCFAGTGAFMGERSLMDAAVGKKALERLCEWSGARRNLEVDFFGGEPLMNIDAVWEIVRYGRELEKKHGKRFHFTLTTNCMALDESVYPLMDEMDNIVLSLDGRKSVHDAMRKTVSGAGSFDTAAANALAAAKRRAAQGKDYYVRGTYTAKNLDFTADVLALRDMGFEQISVEPVVTKAPALAITEGHIEDIKAEYERLAGEYVKSRANGRWFNFFHFMLDLEDGPCASKRLTGCGAGTEYAAVAPNGDIYPCHQFVGMEEFRMGNVYDGIVRSDIGGRFAGCDVFSKPECTACWAKFFCSGGCAASAHKFSGDIAKPYGIACELERKRLECALAVMAIESGK